MRAYKQTWPFWAALATMSALAVPSLMLAAVAK